MVQLLTLLWFFNPSQPALSTLTAQAPQAEFTVPEKDGKSFTVKLAVNLKAFPGEKVLLDIPQVLNVRLRKHEPRDRNRQNYPAYKLPDGSVPVLEANVVLHSSEHPAWKNMAIGIPLGMLKKWEGEHEIVLHFTGVRWTMYVDGRLLDNDFPFGYPQWPDRAPWKIDPEYVNRATLHVPAIEPAKKPAQTPDISPEIQYWIPPGHNSWVGDVVTFFHKERYHVFYLYDRRHHQSKFGCGAHYFEHISTQDFKTWTEHEAATPLEEQWECFGTGTPFVFDNKLCISYGMHTTRVYPREKTTLPAQWEFLKKNGRTGEFRRGTTAGFPAGSTYAVSTDGITNFQRSNIMFHPCENPSVYTDPSGKLRMMANYGANGIWESASIQGGWHCINPGFPPGGDCTFFFRWGKFDYIIGGFTRLWAKPSAAPNSAYDDVVRKGLDFYDGLGVPAITEISGGRFLMAGWIPIRGWGGNLVIRELVQAADGRIGSKWMKEITPATGPGKLVAARVAETTTLPTGSKSFMLTFEVQPAEIRKGRVGVTFLPESGDQAACEFQLRLDDLRAQFGPGSMNAFAKVEKSLHEGGAPHHARNYALENLIGAEKGFTVRVLIQGDDRIGGSLVDAEIAGRRTMISYRPELTVNRMLFRLEGVELANVQIAPLKNQR